MPDYADFIFEKGVILFHAGKKGLALMEMDKAVSLEPENPYRYAGRAYIKDGLGDIHGAIADYETAIRLDPEDSVSHNNLGLLQEKLGWKEKADRNFNRADSLAQKQELFQFIVEQKEQTEPTSAPSQTADPEPESSEGITSVMKKVFTDEGMRREFFQFLKKGLGIRKK
jgi:tetratricopeptide (TPR) repeat protein